jgi:ribosomal protein S18 acetylase RimI-like enzyme
MPEAVERVSSQGFEWVGAGGVAVRLGVSGDLEAVTSLFDAYRVFYRQPSDPVRSRAFLQERFSLRESVLLVASAEKGLLSGFAQLYPSFTSAGTARTWILNDLYVRQENRRQGIGRALVEASVEVARRSGAAAVSLATEETNGAAQPLYEALGFVRDTVFRHYRLKLA